MNDSDMDNYTTPGNYYCSQNDIAATLQNSPFTTAFIMKVEYGNGVSQYPSQTFKKLISGEIAYRVKTESGWSQYVYFSDDNTLFTAVLPSKTFSSTDGPAEADNYLDNYSKNFENYTHYIFSFGAGYNHNPLSGNSLLIEGVKTTGLYEWQQATTYNNSGISIYCRSKLNGSWTDWNKLH